MSTRSGTTRHRRNPFTRRSLRQVGVGLALVIASTLTGMFAITPSAASTTSVAPNSTGLLDCNGYSTRQTPLSRSLKCTDLHGPTVDGNPNGYNGHFYDNGHYIGHDEPSVVYHSSHAGSGNDVTWTETLGVDPTAAPTVSTPGSDVTHTFELTVAPWFGLAICDSNSYPQLNCTPNSDSNAPAPSCITANPCTAFPGGGSAFEELQFYPPGFAPFADAISCDNSHWCAALNIDSLECTEGFANCNNTCIEPINFAFIQTDGVPTGPPSPQLANGATLRQNSHTLLMNPGDKVQSRLFDAAVPGGGGAHALKVVIKDLTTGQSGFMQASAANGFMHTSIVDCSGTPYNFEPEYSSAKKDNIIPWAALQGDIITQFEIGHFVPCSSVSGTATYTNSTGSDPYHLNCAGPYETTAPGGDGSGAPETNDAPCFNAGDTHPGLGGTAPDLVTGCVDTIAQNGDLDFDGTPYWPDWPNSTTPNSFPSTFVQSQPSTTGGGHYPTFGFQTDLALSESTCTGTSGCAVPPPNAPGAFYPYWTLTSSCKWEFGNNTNGNTFGGPTQEYGTNQIAALGYPEFESREYTNRCA